MIMTKDQAIELLRETLKLVSDYTLYCKSTVAEALEATADIQGNKQIAAYELRIKSLTEQLNYHRGLERQYQNAISTLESERAANAILTKELADIQEELSIPEGTLLSMDVSTGDDDIGNRIFGRVYEVMLQSCGSEEDTILAIEESRNFDYEAPEGWQLVPIEPTPAMLLNARAVELAYTMGYKQAYKAMLSAAPEYKKGE